MKKTKYRLAQLILLVALPLFLAAQNSEGTISGLITDANNQPIAGASIIIQPGNKGTFTDQSGKYLIKNIPYGEYALSVSFLGYENIEQQIQLGSSIAEMNFSMEVGSAQLDEVVVKEKSLEQEKREAPIKIEVIDVKKIQAQSISIPQVINQTAGVKVRQRGGIGSGTVLNINGLEGRAIRYFKDGIPMDYLGRAFDLSLLPIDQLDNIEIYKGALPEELGVDALGGGG